MRIRLIRRSISVELSASKTLLFKTTSKLPSRKRTGVQQKLIELGIGKIKALKKKRAEAKYFYVVQSKKLKIVGKVFKKEKETLIEVSFPNVLNTSA